MILPLIFIAGAVLALAKIHSNDQRREVQSALRIMRRVLEKKKDEPRAMYHEMIGTIGFRYGCHHPATKKQKRSGYGLVHVIGSVREDYGPEAAENLLSLIPEIILDGDISETHTNRLRIEYKGHIVLLTKSGKNPKSPHWVFHAYQLREKK